VKLKKREVLLDYDEQDSLSEKIFKIRGICDEDIFEFIRPSRQNLNDPFLLDNMEIAVEMVRDVIRNDKLIAIYSDPDADGVTSCATLYLYLKNFTDNIIHISNQRAEGHGIIPEKAMGMDIGLLIAVDSSTNSVAQCEEVSKSGCKVICIDHHISEGENPFATIVNPKMSKNYPNKELSGSAVVYQFCRAFDMIADIELADNYLDLVSVGLVGDMMPLDNLENRFIVYSGLNVIHFTGRNDTPNPQAGNFGLKSLCKKLKKDYMPTSQDLSFYLVPNLNACIRLNDINIIMDLFLCEDEKECGKIAKKLVDINEERKKLTTEIVDKIIESNKINDNKLLIVDMSKLEFKNAMFGLIANKLSKEFQRPCLIGKVKDGVMIGSGRGCNDEIELKSHLMNSGLFNWVKGHENSFGFEFNIENKNKILSHFDIEFKDYFNEEFIEYDLEIDGDELTLDNMREMDNISVICGQGFPRPSFLIRSIIPDECKKIGKEENHTKLTIFGEQENLDIMKFNTTESLSKYYDCDMINVVGNIGVNSFYNFGLKKNVVTRQILADIIECETIEL